MAKLMKGAGLVLVVLFGLIVVAVVVLNVSTTARLDKVYDIPSEPVILSSSPAAIERGKHLTAYRCVECHGMNFGGSVLLDDPLLGTLTVTNIASGIGRDGLALTDEHFARVMRHGVDAQGRPLLVMPAHAYQYLSEQDLNDIIAYVRSLPAVKDTLPAQRFTILGRALLGAGALGDIIPAELVDHSVPRIATVSAGMTVDYGEYLVKTIGCSDCHGQDLTGGQVPGPVKILGPSLSSGSELSGWTTSDFIRALRTGITPDGRHLSPSMPWIFQGQMSDEELTAIFMYLQSLPVETAAK